MALKPKSASTDTLILVREKLLVLAAISTMQPVQLDLVFQNLTPDLSKEKFIAVLKALRKEGLIGRWKDGRLRATYKGQSVFGSRSLAKARDVSRMLYLVRRNKGGGVAT